jgi:hypothetical protein
MRRGAIIVYWGSQPRHANVLQRRRSRREMWWRVGMCRNRDCGMRGGAFEFGLGAEESEALLFRCEGTTGFFNFEEFELVKMFRQEAEGAKCVAIRGDQSSALGDGGEAHVMNRFGRGRGEREGHRILE